MTTIYYIQDLEVNTKVNQNLWWTCGWTRVYHYAPLW